MLLNEQKKNLSELYLKAFSFIQLLMVVSNQLDDQSYIPHALKLRI